MKEIIEKYHLKFALIVALALPGLFVFQETVPQRMLIRFVSSFLFIFSLWTANFTLVDFSKKRLQVKPAIWYTKIFLAFVITTVLYILIGFTIDSTETMLSQVRGEKFSSPKSWFYLGLRLFLLNCLILIIKYLFDSYKEKRQVEKENELLKSENMNALHEVLKQQLKPHFLFNSLNTLRSLVKRDPETADRFITELASVYRYMLLHQNKNTVTLGEEIEFLESYLYLLRIRFGDAIRTEIRIPEQFLQTVIPPNTLQLLVENAVKHNSFSLNRPLTIAAFIENDTLTVQNNLQHKEENNAPSNLGLQNINSRYSLLFNKAIGIEKNETHFRILLPVK